MACEPCGLRGSNIGGPVTVMVASMDFWSGRVRDRLLGMNSRERGLC